MTDPRPRFLIIRVIALGDVVLATPLVQRIRAEHPDAHVTWVCSAKLAELVALFPGVDSIVPIDEGKLFRGGPLDRAAAIFSLWRRLAGEQFDRVLLMHPDPRYRVLVPPFLGAKVTAARHGPHPHANPILGRFRGDESARLFDGPESRGPIHRRYDILDVRARLTPSAQPAPGRRVVLVPGGARNVLAEAALKRWPVASYRGLAEQLIAKGAEVVLVGDSGDRVFAERFSGLQVRDLVGQLSLVETLEVMRDARVVVAHDTGPLHMARLVRTPAVAIFGPTDPAQFVGPTPDVTVVWGGADLACRPCYDGKNFARCADNICINRIPVAEVLNAVELRLRHS